MHWIYLHLHLYCVCDYTWRNDTGLFVALLYLCDNLICTVKAAILTHLPFSFLVYKFSWLHTLSSLEVCPCCCLSSWTNAAQVNSIWNLQFPNKQSYWQCFEVENKSEEQEGKRVSKNSWAHILSCQEEIKPRQLSHQALQHCPQQHVLSLLRTIPLVAVAPMKHDCQLLMFAQSLSMTPINQHSKRLWRKAQ